MNAAAQAGVNGAARNYAVQQNNPFSFSIEVEAGKVCDQKSSGRCWMFAALNVMRLDLMEKLDLDSTELSQNYPLFYDKLEKANYFLESMLERTIRCSMTSWRRPTIFWKACLRLWTSRGTAAW